MDILKYMQWKCRSSQSKKEMAVINTSPGNVTIHESQVKYPPSLFFTEVTHYFYPLWKVIVMLHIMLTYL